MTAPLEFGVFHLCSIESIDPRYYNILLLSPIIIVSMTTWHGKSVDVVREIAAEKYHHMTSDHHFGKQPDSLSFFMVARCSHVGYLCCYVLYLIHEIISNLPIILQCSHVELVYKLMGNLHTVAKLYAKSPATIHIHIYANMLYVVKLRNYSRTSVIQTPDSRLTNDRSIRVVTVPLG